MYKVYLRKGDLIDANAFYTNIIVEAISQNGDKVEYINSISQIEDNDIIVVINIWAAQEAWGSGKRIKVIVWFQGIAPEEAVISSHGFIDKVKSIIKLRYFEYKTLKKSTLNFFVSRTMVDHYRRIYHYNKNNFYIMPCFNQELDMSSFNDAKYSRPTFVYTGNLAAWQCFEPMVQLFSNIKKELPNATLSIYTQDKDKAKDILSKYGVNAEIKYVPYQILSQEIKQYKYGFIIRENIEINRVATPTKMNSYLASGIIPIYSNVVGAFQENLSNLKYTIPLDLTGRGIEKLYNLEKNLIKASDVQDEFKKVFSNYYSRTRYIKEIADLLSNI